MPKIYYDFAESLKNFGKILNIFLNTTHQAASFGTRKLGGGRKNIIFENL